ncbi:hypothetical protein [uncultured Ruminococcus sp.]|uniref:hypothetical protein n=1 Tax=uncultured Ruminococcus sp. TaxID=165186 RepID=UPI0025DBC21C|nr:hypothetical protein [uncultured Ruminococcus sp.]
MKKLTAMALMLAMVLSLSACGGTSGGNSSTADTSAADTSAADTADTSEADAPDTSAADTADTSVADEDSETARSGAYQMVSFSSEHEPFGIKFDYALPKRSYQNSNNDLSKYHSDNQTIIEKRAILHFGSIALFAYWDK